MSTPIAFADCETTHLDAEIGEAWEVGVILREFKHNGEHADTEYLWEFAIDPAVSTFDPEALRIGRWHERRQLATGTTQAAFTGTTPAVLMSRAEAITAITNLLSGAVLVGSNPAFDDRFLRKLLGPGSAQWHYRPVCIATLAAGKKLGMAEAIRRFGGKPLPSDEVRFPFSSRDLSRWTGIEPPSGDVAHTALGDARWARDVFDAVRGEAS